MRIFLFAAALLMANFFGSAQTWTCSNDQPHGSAMPLTPTALYTSTAAGWDLQPPPLALSKDGCSSSQPFFFSAPVVEGNYFVTVVLGADVPAVTTVKAEARRAMLVGVATKAHGSRTETFVVNVRRPEIPGGTVVKRKPREMGALDWDEKLTLEFNGAPAAVRSIEIHPAPPTVPTLYLAGDSTVVDQDKEPWAAWGQMLPAFVGPRLAIANHAESGETLRSFVGEQRFAKIFSLLKRGDYLMFQFAHNDQKPGAGNVPPAMYTDLLRHYIAMTRERGATPILVTSMNRRTFDAEGHITDTLAPYPQLMRQVALAEHVELIDLSSLSKTLYEAIGEANSRSLFVYAAANTYPGQTEALHDDTHFNAYGAWEIARLVVLGLQQKQSPLLPFLRRPAVRFDPLHFDQPANVRIPPTPFVDLAKPYER